MADINAYITRPSSDAPDRMDRHNELAHWNREIALESAAHEEIELGDRHWKVIPFYAATTLTMDGLPNPAF